jgi:hypothetical protein
MMLQYLQHISVCEDVMGHYFFLFIVPSGPGKYLVKRTRRGVRSAPGIEDWIADGPVPLLKEPPASELTQDEVGSYFDTLRRGGYIVKRVG